MSLGSFAQLGGLLGAASGAASGLAPFFAGGAGTAATMADALAGVPVMAQPSFFGTIGDAASSLYGGAQAGLEYGSMADKLLGTGQPPQTLPTPQIGAPAKKPLSALPPPSEYAVSSVLDTLPPELRQAFQGIIRR